jgi:photosystem II stability/assembly factor-like uncharacterized protein
MMHNKLFFSSPLLLFYASFSFLTNFIVLALTITILVLPESTPCAQWSLVNPSLTGSPLYDIAFLTPSVGIAVGANGIVARTIDSGNTWTLQPTPVEYPAPLLSIAFFDENMGYAVGGVFGRTFAIRTFDGGVHWSDATTLFPQGGLRKILIYKESIWVIHWSRTPNLSVSRDTCATWASDTIGDGSFLHDLLFLDDSVGFACGDLGFIGKTGDGGKTWTIKSDSLGGIYQRLCFPSLNNGFAIALGGGIAQTNDLNDQWFWNSGFGGQLNVIHFFNPDSGFILGSWNPTMCIKTEDGGTSWTVNATSVLPQVTAVAFPGKERGVGVCWNGAIHFIHGLADSTREITANTGLHIAHIDFCDSLHGIAGSRNDGAVFLTDDAGATWVKSVIPDSSGILAINGFSNGRILCTMANSEFISPDYGRTWSAAASSRFFNRIFKKEPFSMEAYGVASDDKLYYSQDAGVSWRERGIIAFSNLKQVDGFKKLYFLSPEKGWALSVHGSVSRTVDSGYTWNSAANIPEDISVNDVFFYDESHGWVCGAWGSFTVPLIFFTSNGGATWIKQPNISFNRDLALPTDLIFQAQMFKIRSRDLSAILGLFDGGMIASFDTGKSWKQQTLPQYGSHFFDMFMAQNGDMHVVGDNSRIWKYTADKSNILERNPPIGLHNKKGYLKPMGYGELYDIKGRKVARYNITNVDAVKTLLKAKNLSSGIYFFKSSENAKESIVRKVIP